jgi:hypothetical protein
MIATEQKGATPESQLGLFEQPGNDDVLATLAAFFDSTKEELEDHTRRYEVVRVRHIVMYILREYGGMSFPAIGRLIGKRDHTTVIHGVNKVKREIAEHPELLDLLDGPVSVARALQSRKKKVEKELEEINAKLYANAVAQIHLTKMKRQPPKVRAIPERNIKVLELYREGLTLENISKVFAVTRERIRQIVLNTIQSQAINESITKGIMMDVDLLLEEEAQTRKKAQNAKKPVKEVKIKQNRWSIYYDACKVCNSTVYPHVRSGMCEQCLGSYRGDIREKIISEHSGQCDVCHISRSDAFKTYGRDLYIQKDRNVLCRKCFLADSGNRMGHYKKYEWSRFYPACKKCATTTTPHASSGLCENCAPVLTTNKREKVIASKGSKCTYCGISRTNAQGRYSRDLYVTKDRETYCSECFHKYIRGKKT